MTVRITRTGGSTGSRATLRVEGTLTIEGADLLDGVCSELVSDHAAVTLNLSNVPYVDRTAAATLRRLVERGVAIEEPNDFVRQMIELDD